MHSNFFAVLTLLIIKKRKPWTSGAVDDDDNVTKLGKN